MLPLTLCGNDFTLLATRKLLLESHGLSVQTVCGVAALEGVKVAALLLCYTLSHKERMQAISLCDGRIPRGRILVLGGDVREQSYDGCETLTAYPSPRRLLEKACQLVHAVAV